MSLFDTPEKRNLAQVFPPGTPFRLVEGWIEGQVQTPGTGAVRTLAKVVVSPVTEPANEAEFGVWGSLCEQVRKIEPGELPAIVTLDNSTGVWLFAAHAKPPETVDNGNGETVEQPRTAVPEAHLDLSSPDADPPAPVPPAARPVGTDLDESQTSSAPALPPPAPPRGTEIDESQTFDPKPGNQD
jgi:hypothetical protein